jgi:glutathione S-transferase
VAPDEIVVVANVVGHELAHDAAGPPHGIDAVQNAQKRRSGNPQGGLRRREVRLYRLSAARRLYKESFFGGRVSEETKSEARSRLTVGLSAVDELASLSPHIAGEAFTAADCAAAMHFIMIRPWVST